MMIRQYKVRKETTIPFHVVEYDEFSVNAKKKITSQTSSLR